MSEASTTGEAQVTVLVDARCQAALDGFRRNHTPVLTRVEAIQLILAEWTRSNASPGAEALADQANASADTVDEGLRPSQLNASNDI